MASRIAGITVEIGGDTTKLQTALKGVNSSIKETQSSLKDVEKLLKMDPGNTELLTQKQNLLKDAISETKEKLTTLKTAAEQANEALSKGEISEKQYDALQREIAETEQKLKSLETQASQSSTALQSISACGTKLQSVGSAVSSVGTALAPISAAATAVGVAGVKAATDWETAFTGVKKTVDATEEEYEALAEGIQKMATQTASSMEEIAGVMEVAGQLGIAKENLLEFTQVMVELGDTTNLSAEEAATSLARFINITGDSQDSVGRLGAAIVDLGNNFATDEASIVSMSTRLASAGTIAGLSSTDILALAAAMSSVGIEAEAGGTAMTQTLSAMETAVSNFAAGSTGDLEAIASVANMSAQEFATAWNTDPITAVQAFIAGLGQLDEKGESATLVLDELGMSGVRQSNMLKSLALASGVLSDAIDTSSTAYANNTALTAEAEKRYSTFASQISQVKESLKTVAIDIGETLIPILKSLIEKLQGVVEWWTGLSDTQRKIIVDIGLVVAALAPVLIVVGKVISAVGTIMTILPKLSGVIQTVQTAFSGLSAVMAANPIVLVIAAIAALVAAFIYLWNNCESFREFWIGLWEGIKNVVVTVWTAISEFFSAIWQSIQAVATAVWGAISSFITAIWNGISTVITTIVSGIANFLSTAWNTIKNVISNVVGAIANVVSSAFSTMFNAVSSIVGNIASAIASGFNSAVNFIKGLASQAFSWGADIISGIVSGIWSMIGRVVDAVKSVASTIASYLHFSVPDKGPLTDFESWMPDFMSGLAKGIEDSKAMVSKAILGVADVMDFESALPDMQADLTATVNGGRSSSDNGEVKLSQPILIDGKTITTIVSEIQYQRGKASLRNLGTA